MTESAMKDSPLRPIMVVQYTNGRGASGVYLCAVPQTMYNHTVIRIAKVPQTFNLVGKALMPNVVQ